MLLGCAGVIVGHPFDTIKVHLQTQDARNPVYRGTLHCFKSLVAKNGIMGLYKGISSPLTGVAAINAIVFGVYGNVQRRSTDPESLRSHFFAGAAAGFAQSILCSPMELVKTRVQLMGSGSPFQCLKNIYRSEGVRGVFKGYGLTVMREIPAFSSYFVTYELLTKTDSDVPVSTVRMLLAGGLAGTASWVITYPVDVIKSRLQSDGMAGPAKYTGALDCLKKSTASEGYSFLSRGLFSTILRAFPTNAACFTVVTWTFRLCADLEQEKPVEEKQITRDPPMAVLTDSNLWDKLGQTLASFEHGEISVA